MARLKLDPESLTVTTFAAEDVDGWDQAQSITDTPFYATTGGPGLCVAYCDSADDPRTTCIC